jgi:hypothetical protein
MPRSKRYMDRFDSPINPCSVETIPFPLKLADDRLVWPMAVSCYELHDDDGGGRGSDETNPSTMTSTSRRGGGRRRRIGSVSFFMVQVPDVANDFSGSPLSFPADEPDVWIESPSGILDGHWRQQNDEAPLGSGNGTGTTSRKYLFATAHSSGEVQIHALQVIPEAHRYVDTDPLIQVSFVCSSASSPTRSNSRSASSPSSTTTDVNAALCLSVNWDHDAPRLVATYSNGRMAVFDYVQLDDNPDDDDHYGTTKGALLEIEIWNTAHSLFKVPSEVWSAAFVNRDLLFSGGDDCKLKVWDVRAASRPVQTLDCFDAGVTCISSHAAVENLVAAGSCTCVGCPSSSSFDDDCLSRNFFFVWLETFYR